MTVVKRDGDAKRLLEAIERKLHEAPSKIWRSYGDGPGYSEDGFGTGEAMTLAAFFREVAVEINAPSLLGNAEILDRVARELSELDRRDEEAYQREMAEEYRSEREALKKRSQPPESSDP